MGEIVVIPSVGGDDTAFVGFDEIFADGYDIGVSDSLFESKWEGTSEGWLDGGREGILENLRDGDALADFSGAFEGGSLLSKDGAFEGLSDISKGDLVGINTEGGSVIWEEGMFDWSLDGTINEEGDDDGWFSWIISAPVPVSDASFWIYIKCYKCLEINIHS